MLTALLLAALLRSAHLQLLPPSDVASIILGFRTEFHIKCVFLLSSAESGARGRDHVVGVSKLLSKNSVTALSVGLNINATRNCTRSRPLNVLLTADKETAEALARLKKIPSSPRWLVFINASDTDAFLASINALYDSELITATPGDGDVVEFAEVYSVQVHDTLVHKTFGNWSRADGLNLNTTPLFHRRANLHGSVIRAVVTHLPPMMILQLDPKNASLVTGVSGYFGDAWTAMQESLNFTTTYVVDTGNVKGILLSNGSWNGIIKTMVTGLAEVSPMDFTRTNERQTIISFLQATLITQNRMFIRKPNAIDLSWSNFLAPFSLTLWMSILGTILVLALSLAAVYRLGRHYGNAEAEGHNLIPLNEAVIFIHGLMCGQGHELTPRAMSGRIMYLIAALVGITVVAAYSAALISFLAVQTINYPFNSFQELLDIGYYKMGFLSGSGIYNLWQLTEDPLLKSLFNKLVLPNEVTIPSPNISQGLKNVCRHPFYGFLTSYETATKALAEPECNLATVPGISMLQRYSMVTVKDYPLHGVLNYMMFTMRQSGVLSRLHIKYWPPSYPETDSIFNSVTVEQVTPIMAILVAGISAAILLFCLEAGRRRCCKPRRRPRDVRQRRPRQVPPDRSIDTDYGRRLLNLYKRRPRLGGYGRAVMRLNAVLLRAKTL